MSSGGPRSRGPLRMVVLRALNLGDLLTAVPALRALRDAFPGHHTTLVTPRTFTPLVEREGLADAVSDSHELAPLDRSLAGPDLAVDLHGRGPGSQPLLLALRPRRLVAFAHPDVAATGGMPVWREDEHEVDRWCRLLSESGIPAARDRLAITVPPVELPWDSAGVTVVHPGAAAPARRWPLERWAAVVSNEVAAGRAVAITGSTAEMTMAESLAALVPGGPVSVMAGRTDLDQLIALVGAAGRVISGDTGVAHVAFATGTPSITLYGPVPPSEWGPPPGRSRHRALWAGRRGDPHGSRLDPGLEAIKVDDVVAAGRVLDSHAEQATPDLRRASPHQAGLTSPAL